eukprot:PITA_24438
MKEAVDSEDGKLWKEAMVDEMASLHKNEAWDLVELPSRRKPIGNKWVFKKKTNAEGKVEKYKARFIVKGYSQVSGIDFGDIFSHVSKVISIRLLLSVVVAFDFEIEQKDVKTTFLHGHLEDEIYMKQPEGFVVKGKKELECKLKYSLYGLKQSPRMLYQKFDTFIRRVGFTGSKEDHCVYFKLIGDHVIYLVLYVDDMLLVGNDKEIIQDLKTHLSSKFDMKDLSATNYILGMEIKRDRTKRKLWLNQRNGSIEQVCVKTREGALDSSERVFRYLRGTSVYGLCYRGGPVLDKVLDIHGFVDANWVGDLDHRRSTSAYVSNLFGGALSWMSKKQSVVALSTIEAKYMAATHASKESVWLQRLSSNMGLVQGSIRIDYDSQSAIFLAKKPTYHSKTKHIDVQYHFVRDMIEDKKVLLVKVDTLRNTADALTKFLTSGKFSWCTETMGIAGLDK